MTCGGCSGAVTKILGKIDGVREVDANLATKIVKVVTDLAPTLNYFDKMVLVF